MYEEGELERWDVGKTWSEVRLCPRCKSELIHVTEDCKREGEKCESVICWVFIPGNVPFLLLSCFPP